MPMIGAAGCWVLEGKVGWAAQCWVLSAEWCLQEEGGRGGKGDR